MLRIRLSQLLQILWKLSTVFVIPIIILAYVSIINAYLGDFTFQHLDQGQNRHKWAVLAVYLLYLLFWNRCNKRVLSYLQILEYS